MRPPLQPGPSDGAYPENVQGDPDFNVGGVARTLPEELQLEQIDSYIRATYPETDPDTFGALLPDRLTHAALLMLGTAVDHTMPGVAFTAGVTVEATELGTLFVPSRPTGKFAVALAPGLGPKTREYAWYPEVAAVAELSGTTLLDAPTAQAARQTGYTTAWFYRCAPAFPAETCVLTFPPTGTYPRDIFVQTEEDYFTRGGVSTPAQARRRVTDVAEFLWSRG
ncbi:hypothetical protein CAPI_00330 [Corynebacterium capitovis DSM 44611]|uniref:hypothetical protein n=1 Tax=Corynebacterium capitovis TaxID=131081 RepID=UPI000376A112|nr:hypothetical protein [Corynebacterium capitovis]WKD56653.1 hypothetical protein CAPI_00330 [Corynebacterium capitovis DSM 44611]